MTAFLPQRDPDPQRRQKELEDRREVYQFNYQHVSPLAILNRVPVHDEFSFEWLTTVAERVLVGLANRAELDEDSQLKGYHHVRRGMLSRLISIGEHASADIKMLVSDALKFHGRIGAPARPAESLQEFVELYRAIGLPPIAKDYLEDRIFAAMRTAGPNPVMLQRMAAVDSRLPITDELFEATVPGDSLDAAMAEGRLYLADYAILDGAELGDFPNGQKYLYAALALFVVDRDSKLLTPVAIQCQQQPGPKNPIFTPADGWNWAIAKTMVEIADGNVHEASTHLGRTHLLMEPFVVSAFRQLAPNHPLSVLLIPHFEGTLAINAAAWQHLIADRGAVDKLFGGTIKTSRTVAAEGVRSVRIMQDVLPNSFAARGVDDTDVFPTYP